jgi:hypothetical protein
MRLKRASVPNPGRRSLRPVEIITDRAKRYRANADPPPGPRICNFCAAERNIDIDHVTGDESDGTPENKIFLCRPCNAAKGFQQKNAKIGTRTRQYNPNAPPTFTQFYQAGLVLIGAEKGSVKRATAIVKATSPSRRADFARQIEKRIRKNPAPPSYEQYVHAVTTHSRGSHDEGGKIIHATPPALRREYAQQIASLKASRRGSRPRNADAVPF